MNLRLNSFSNLLDLIDLGKYGHSKRSETSQKPLPAFSSRTMNQSTEVSQQKSQTNIIFRSRGQKCQCFSQDKFLLKYGKCLNIFGGSSKKCQSEDSNVSLYFIEQLWQSNSFVQFLCIGEPI